MYHNEPVLISNLRKVYSNISIPIDHKHIMACSIGDFYMALWSLVN